MKSLEYRLLTELPRDPNNARTHSPEQIEQIADSIRRFGFTMPGMFDTVLRAGNGRADACELIYAAGETIYLAPGKDRGGEAIPIGTMPVFDCSGWSEDERRAYALADNKLAINAGWDDERLRAELEALMAAGFEVPVIGFAEDELAALFNPPQTGRADPDELPDAPENPATRPGDVWIMGDHRIKCGSATDAGDVDSVLNGSRPHLMVTDPPYGVNYNPKWREDERGHVASFRNAAKSMGVVENDDRCDWREAWELFAGDVAYIWHAGNKAHLVAESLIACGLEVRAQIIWKKQHFIISRGDYHPQHEPCFYAVRKGKRGHWNGDRKQSTVWDVDTLMPVGRKGTAADHVGDEKTDHSTQKPVECMRRPILNNSKPGELVYEPFSGSGTTIIACEMEGRGCRAIELSPTYVDMAIIRWQQFAGKDATLEATGQTFAAVKAERELALEAAT